ncbi:MAG TPA: FtsQ-type POTRA domain-containing protein, partial [Ilumatobacteraceae bacterium]|nr:FtsQ-type POTRA domain-containing protein [Ilumatobacteraceae bacterium]
ADPADPEPVVLNPILLDPGLAEPASPPSSPGEAEAGEAAPAGPLAPPARRTIRIGGDDDGAMDPVYLDEEGAGRLRGETDRQTEASVERTTIFIGDDDLDGASGGIPIATGSASIDPRLRARRIAVKRALGRKRLKWVVLAVVVVLLITSVLALLGSSLFRVQQIEVSGRSGTTNEAIEAAVAELKDTPVLLVDTHAIEEQLERSPWIREARVATDFPHGASIEVVERVPLATYPGTDGRWRIIDVEGVVLTVIANRPLAFMEIEGPGADAEAGGSAGQALRHAAELVEALTPAVRSRTQKVLVDPTGELRLQFADTTVELGAAENLLDKLTWLEVVIKSGRVDDCSVVNVTTRDVGCVPAR